MLNSVFQTTFRLAAVTFAAILSVSVATPALAVDGRSAVGVCIDSAASGAQCTWSVNSNGEIDICNKSGCVYCASATAECTTEAKGRTRPTRTLPVGATIKIPFLDVEITGKPFSGPISEFRCSGGDIGCPGHGCIPANQVCKDIPR